MEAGVSLCDAHCYNESDYPFTKRQDGSYVPTTRDKADNFLRFVAQSEYDEYSMIGKEVSLYSPDQGLEAACRDGSAYHALLCPVMLNTIKLGTWIAAVGAVSHLSELPEECNFYGNHAEERHKFKGPPRGMKVLYYMETAQDEVTSQESMLLYGSKFWGVMNETDDDGNIVGEQRLFLEIGTPLQYFLAHDNDSHTVPSEKRGKLQRHNMWLLITTKGTHFWWSNYSCTDAKNFMLAMGLNRVLRVDGTIGQWDPGTSPSSPDGDREWEAHKLLHCKAIQRDFREAELSGVNQGHDAVKITVNQTAQKIEFEVRFPFSVGISRLGLKRVLTPVVSRIRGDDKPVQVRLYSRARNRHDEPLWERPGSFAFTLCTAEPDVSGLLYEVAFVTLENVPVGWAILEVWAEDPTGPHNAPKKTMQVFVYPEIRCKYEGGRWKLLLPMEEALPFSPVELGPMPVPLPGRLIPWIRLKDGVYTIDAALWKQRDDYFQGTRYDPAGITDYNHQDVNFSVDEQDTGVPGATDGLKVYCAPGYAPGPDPSQPGSPCVVPQYESERVEVIVLQLLQTIEPGKRVLPVGEPGSGRVIVKKTGGNR